MEWGKGLTQKREREEKLKNDLYEAEKPLARYKSDKDLEQILKDQDREGYILIYYLLLKKNNLKIKFSIQTIPCWNTYVKIVKARMVTVAIRRKRKQFIEDRLRLPTVTILCLAPDGTAWIVRMASRRSSMRVSTRKKPEKRRRTNGALKTCEQLGFTLFFNFTVFSNL